MSPLFSYQRAVWGRPQTHKRPQAGRPAWGILYDEYRSWAGEAVVKPDGRLVRVS